MKRETPRRTPTSREEETDKEVREENAEANTEEEAEENSEAAVREAPEEETEEEAEAASTETERTMMVSLLLERMVTTSEAIEAAEVPEVSSEAEEKEARDAAEESTEATEVSVEKDVEVKEELVRASSEPREPQSLPSKFKLKHLKCQRKSEPETAHLSILTLRSHDSRAS